jgi:hypothetical protein
MQLIQRLLAIIPPYSPLVQQKLGSQADQDAIVLMHQETRQHYHIDQQAPILTYHAQTVLDRHQGLEKSLVGVKLRISDAKVPKKLAFVKRFPAKAFRAKTVTRRAHWI